MLAGAARHVTGVGSGTGRRTVDAAAAEELQITPTQACSRAVTITSNVIVIVRGRMRGGVAPGERAAATGDAGCNPIGTR
jgi:hypothetical protein